MGKIIHLFPREKFTSNIINLVNQYFGTEKHLFIVYYAGYDLPLAVEDDANVVQVHSLFGLAPPQRQALEEADKIIAHSLSGPVVQYLSLHPAFWKKLYVLFWGYEMEILATPQKGLRNRVYKVLIALLARRAKGVLTLLSREKEVLRRYVNYRGKHFLVRYSAPDETARRDAYRVVEKPTDPYWFILGNNANASNHQVEVMEQLATYSDENFKVVVPLSYGSAENRDVVLREGPRILGEKFVPLTEYMPVEEYYAILGKCAVGFFANHRQQAMGNINALGHMGAKIYLRRGAVMWQVFVEDQGYQYFDIADVGRVPFEELVRISEEQVETNRAGIAWNVDPQRMVDEWRVVFDDP